MPTRARLLYASHYMVKYNDLTASIERLEAMEDRLKVELSSLSAFIRDVDDPEYLEVQGELRSTEGGKLVSDIDIQVVAYDNSGRVVGSGHSYFSAESYFGVDVIEATVLCYAVPARVRVYPKASE